MSKPLVFGKIGAEVFVPDGRPEGEALGRTTHMAVARTRTTSRSWRSTGCSNALAVQTSHGVDSTSALCLAMDLTPLIHDSGSGIAAFAQAYIDRFAAEVRARIERSS